MKNWDSLIEGVFLILKYFLPKFGQWVYVFNVFMYDFELKILETKTPDLEAQRFREEYYRDKNTHENWKDKNEKWK